MEHSLFARKQHIGPFNMPRQQKINYSGTKGVIKQKKMKLIQQNLPACFWDNQDIAILWFVKQQINRMALIYKNLRMITKYIEHSSGHLVVYSIWKKQHADSTNMPAQQLGCIITQPIRRRIQSTPYWVHVTLALRSMDRNFVHRQFIIPKLVAKCI